MMEHRVWTGVGGAVVAVAVFCTGCVGSSDDEPVDRAAVSSQEALSPQAAPTGCKHGWLAAKVNPNDPAQVAADANQDGVICVRTSKNGGVLLSDDRI